MDYQILSDVGNGLTTRSVWVLIMNGQSVRRAEAIIDIDDDATTEITARLADLYATGTDEPNGIRAWFAIKQRHSDELLDQAIFAVFAVLQQGGSLSQMVAAGESVINASPFHADLYDKFKTAYTAGVLHRERFIVMALLVAFSKIGQR